LAPFSAGCRNGHYERRISSRMAFAARVEPTGQVSGSEVPGTRDTAREHDARSVAVAALRANPRSGGNEPASPALAGAK
jgi:hypothetical protein